MTTTGTRRARSPGSTRPRARGPYGSRPETFDVIREALHTSEISEGTFDITFETMHGLWKFDQDLDPHPPTPAAVRAQVKYVGYRHVKLDPAASTVFLDEPHVRIGLGGIAKGYAVDHASTVVLLDGGLCRPSTLRRPVATSSRMARSRMDPPGSPEFGIHGAPRTTTSRWCP